MNKLIFFFIYVFFISGCVKKVSFQPNELPDGRVGEMYYVPVNVSGGSGPIVDFHYEVHPYNSGLKLKFDTEKFYTKYLYNKFVIEGKPQFPREFCIKMKGGLVGGAGQGFEKIYKIKVAN
ncbi:MULTISPECIES: hypothetical protein [unclassified Enterobacter]|uniref:hypothetical protein n=1 Tax=unclassified Enterobacter TaxID=2608935 RepID=UPI0015CEF3F9|nr:MULTISPECIES: hypothetical protein [unclassified Enterobacter]MBB3303952.1 hypothetical protein [Enterobacter sp. Sphag1F]NYI12943.1 hypothetical protein [Enterobacter sp. Sphag71]